MQNKIHRLQLVGWRAFYKNKIYSSHKYKWKNLPRDGMVILQKYYEAFDHDDQKIEQDGKSLFYELIYGRPTIALDVESIRAIKRLPKVIKFMDIIDNEHLNELKEKIDKGEL